jgi:hypothetical protein
VRVPVVVAGVDTRFSSPGAPAGSFPGHDGRVGSLFNFNRISAPFMGQQTASGSWWRLHTAGDAVLRVRHRSAVICSIARFIAHGVYRPSR